MPEPDGRPDASHHDEIQGRLENFRATYKTDKPNRALLALQFVLILAGFIGLYAILLNRPPAKTSTSGNSEHSSLRGLAAYFAEKGQPEAALDTYRDFLTQAALEDTERATICYSVAQLALDMEDYSIALRYLYESEFLDPQSERKAKIDQQILRCLDKLGRSEVLRRELRTRSSLNKASSLKTGDVVLAEFAGETITRSDLDREIEKLPASLRDSFKEPGKRADFLKNLVAERLLLDKALRLDYDKDPSVQETLAQQRDSLVVRKLIDEEVRAKLNITDADIQRFYKAEIQQFTRPTFALGSLGTATTKDDAIASATDNPEAPQVRITPGKIQGADLTDATVRSLSEAVLTAGQDAITTAVESDGIWYAFEGNVTPESVTPFESAKAQASRLLHARKEQELLDALIAQTLEARKVKLHIDRLVEPVAQ